VYTERTGPTLEHTLATALVGLDGRVVEVWRGNGWKTSEVLAALHAAGLAKDEQSPDRLH
jgi:protein SCO1/2